MVSIILPVYNGKVYLKAAIESILMQNYSGFELIILDDGSTEDIKSIISLFSDNRIKFFSRENKGLGATLNELVRKANYDLIFRMDADDIAHNNRLQKQVEFMEKNRDVVLSGSQINFFNEHGKIKAREFPASHELILEDLLNSKFSICHPSIVFRKKIFDRIGGYETEGAGEDLDFFLRMSLHGRLANVDEILLDYRIHDKSLNVTKVEELENGYINAIYRYKNNYAESIQTLKASSFSVFLRKYQTKFYRSYISKLIEGKSFQAYRYLFLTAILNPLRAYYFIIRKFRKGV